MFRAAFLRLLRTTGFRLALQSIAISVCGALLVFTIIYQASEAAVRTDLESTVQSEKLDVLADAHDDGSIIKAVEGEIAESVGTFYALTGPDGAMLAGNLSISPPVAAQWTGMQTLTREDGLALPKHVTAIRGLASRLGNGDVLYVAENASALSALNHLIANAFAAVFCTILALGLAGGLLAARSTLRRVDAISETSRDIMRGDLSRRINLRNTGDEFDRLAISLNNMLDRIQALMENIRQVTNDIAHDLRSPLARLREHLELARNGTTAPDLQLVFDKAITQTDAALSIFAALLRIAEIEAGARRSHFMMVDISGMLLDLKETFETVAEAEAQSLTANIAPGLTLTGDRELLTQMFVNVIENAIHHCPAGSKISLHAQIAPANCIDITIADNGPGIPADDRQRVLNRFVRLDAARHSPGSGLGLALVAAIAALHGGSIALEDNQPGLRFIISLPLG
jgi:signal transduction histidine kinase